MSAYRVLFIWVILSVLSHSAQALSVDEFLYQVVHSNDGYLSDRENSDGSISAAEGSNLLFKPQIFSNLQYIYDPRDTHAPALEGDKTLGESVSVGLREQTPWGVKLQLSMDYNQSTLLGISSPLVTRPTVTNLYPVPGFNWSLWQNWEGHLDQANQRLLESQSLAESYGSRFQAQVHLVEAEGVYWKLASLRESIHLLHDSLDRAHSLLELDQKKAKNHLIDSSDMLLSEAAVQGKELELKSILGEERIAARAFNEARGLDSEDVSDQLTLPSPESFYEWKFPNQTGARGDLKALEQQQIAAQAGYQVAREKLLPNLNLYGSIFAVGLNFSMPLDFSLTSDTRLGYARKINASELNFRRKSFEQKTQWQDLKTRFEDLVERLKLAVKLESLQKRKFEDVRRRREHGMTIAFQVFQYELDYLNAAQNRVQIETALLALRAQLKLYAEDAS